MRTLIRRIAVSATAFLALTAGVASPASAGVNWDEENFFQSVVFLSVSRSEIWRNPTSGLPNRVHIGSGLFLEHAAVVSATSCWIETWSELQGASGNTWDTPRVISDCMNTIRPSGRDKWHYYADDKYWGTSGIRAKGHLCVYLQYGSSVPGWVRCRDGFWVGL
jgi:hypothetical protein